MDHPELVPLEEDRWRVRTRPRPRRQVHQPARRRWSKAPLRAIRLLVLLAVLPAAFICVPVYLRYRVFSGQMYPMGMTDMRLIDSKISTTWCQRQVVRSNSTFNAFVVPQSPEMAKDLVPVSMTRHLLLDDDMKEYWGFYLLQGSTVTVSTCVRWPGASLIMIKGYKHLQSCAYIGDDSSEELDELLEANKLGLLSNNTLLERILQLKKEDGPANDPGTMRRHRDGIHFHHPSHDVNNAASEPDLVADVTDHDPLELKEILEKLHTIREAAKMEAQKKYRPPAHLMALPALHRHRDTNVDRDERRWLSFNDLDGNRTKKQDPIPIEDPESELPLSMLSKIKNIDELVNANQNAIRTDDDKERVTSDNLNKANNSNNLTPLADNEIVPHIDKEVILKSVIGTEHKDITPGEAYINDGKSLIINLPLPTLENIPPSMERDGDKHGMHSLHDTLNDALELSVSLVEKKGEVKNEFAGDAIYEDTPEGPSSREVYEDVLKRLQSLGNRGQRILQRLQLAMDSKTMEAISNNTETENRPNADEEMKELDHLSQVLIEAIDEERRRPELQNKRHEARMAAKVKRELMLGMTNFEKELNQDDEARDFAAEEDVEPDGYAEHHHRVNETTAFDMSNSEFWSSFSSSEEALLECDGLILNLPLTPHPECREDVSEDGRLKASQRNAVTYRVPADGYYFFVFNSENEVQTNFINVRFDLQKTIYDVARTTLRACKNTTSRCDLSLDLFSNQKVVLELPLRDNESLWNEQFVVLSECEPRTSIYLACVIAVPLFIMLFALH